MPLLHVQITSIESGCLIAYFRRSDVREERADGIAQWVIPVIEFVHAQAFYCGKGGIADIVHHRDKAADLWRKAGDVADQKEVSFIHSKHKRLSIRPVRCTVARLFL